jgi:addiction module RelE/StbE family toxin
LLSIIQYIADDNLAAAQRLKDEIESKVGKLPHHPKLYRAGRVFGTREMIVRANYVIVYAEEGDAITILRVLHAAQLWPPENKKR